MLPRFAPVYLIAAGLLTTQLLTAQTPSAPAPDQTGDETTAKHQISSQLFAEIRLSLPTYTVPEPKKPEPAAPETGDAVVLQKMVIFGSRPAKLSERDFATKSGLSDLLFKRYPGASIRGQDPCFMGKAPNYAALMFADDERLEHIATLERTADDLQVTGALKSSKALKKEISRTLMRRIDWRTEAMDRSANGGRR